MSDLINRLEQALRGTAAKPIGFGPAATRPPAAQLVLVLALPRPAAELLPALAAAGADGVMLPAAPEAEFVTAAKEHKLVWGVRAGVTGAQDVQALKEAGCDFVVYEVDSPAHLFDQAGIGQVLELESGAAEALAGGLERLAPAAVYLPLDDMPYLSIRRVILCQRLARLGHKPLLVQAHPAIAAEELATLCDAGAAGVVVEARGPDVPALAKRLRGAIAALPPRGKRTKAPRATAILPRLHLAPTDADEGEPPEEPDEGE
ncbi:MAG: hypothetical protein HY330_04175 [Chloroflexi bacterium]|nr:hypothetical protein [Chloroflexota bacterium]